MISKIDLESSLNKYINEWRIIDLIHNTIMEYKNKSKLEVETVRIVVINRHYT